MRAKLIWDWPFYLLGYCIQLLIKSMDWKWLNYLLRNVWTLFHGSVNCCHIIRFGINKRCIRNKCMLRTTLWKTFVKSCPEWNNLFFELCSFGMCKAFWRTNWRRNTYVNYKMFDFFMKDNVITSWAFLKRGGPWRCFGLLKGRQSIASVFP